jgi:hypothetical protein
MNNIASERNVKKRKRGQALTSAEIEVDTTLVADEKKKEAKKGKEAKTKKSEAREKRRETTGESDRLPGTAGATSIPESIPRDEIVSEKDDFPSKVAGLCKQNVDFVVSMLPSGLHDRMKQIHDSIQQSFLLRYSHSLRGILLAYDSVEILENDTAGGSVRNSAGHGRILNEMPYIHYTVRCCNALVFQPNQPGCVLGGQITGSFDSHIALLVFNYFHASVSAAELRRAHYEFNSKTEQWYYTKKVPNQTSQKSSHRQVLDLGTSIEFVVEKVHEANGIISLDGHLHSPL